MLFCLRCNGDVTLQDEEVTFQLRISDEEWQTTKALFVDRGFINSDNEVLNWDKRQFISDSSAERVSKHREKKKQECNVTVTPPEQNRTYTEQSRTKKPKAATNLNYDDYPEFLEFWSVYPIKEGKMDALKSWIASNPPIEKVLSSVRWQLGSKKWKDG